MSKYAMEDIELLRSKSGIGYQEAVALLDYHNGDLAQALIDLERQGKLRSSGMDTMNKGMNQKKGMNILQKLFRTRFKVSKGDTPIVNLSLLFSLITALISPHIAVIGLIASLVLGYRITLDSDDPAFEKENLERMVRSAAENVRQSVSGIARDISQAVDQANASKKAEPQHTAEPARETAEQPAETAAQSGSFYNSSSYSAFMKTPGSKHGGAPILQVPVKVDSADGNVSYQSEGDGYNSVTVE